jgi:hypothetical protein
MREAMNSFLSRRSFIGGAVLLPALARVLSAAAAADASKASQASMHYQTSPKGDSQCSKCQFFIPGKDAQSTGTCRIVDGSISPNGYCMAFAAK